jgi:hypothetical protein
MGMSQPEITDWRGTKIDVGDTIVYAVKESASADIHEAVVAEITTYNPGYGKDQPRIIVEWKRSNYDPNGQSDKKRRILGKPSNLTVIKKVTAPNSIYGPHTEMRHPEWERCKS